MEWLHTSKQREALKQLLFSQGLSYEDTVTNTALLYDAQGLLASASYEGRVIKMVVVRAGEKGQDHMAKVLSFILKALADEKITHTFVYTTLDKKAYFEPFGYRFFAHTDQIALGERGGDIKHYLNQQTRSLPTPQDVGCVVINANPLTLGHAHLIDTLAKNHPTGLVFVVEEDHSVFPFHVRFSLVETYAQKYPHVTVLSTGPYLVSKASFPSYFLSDEAAQTSQHAALDVAIYERYFKPIFNLKKRYVGEEPFSHTTALYNEVMAKTLGDHLVIIPRLTLNTTPISASEVRRRLKTEDMAAVRAFLPEHVNQFLTSKEGREIIECLKTRHDRHS